jgi:hypothetical protein
MPPEPTREGDSVPLPRQRAASLRGRPPARGENEGRDAGANLKAQESGETATRTPEKPPWSGAFWSYQSSGTFGLLLDRNPKPSPLSLQQPGGEHTSNGLASRCARSTRRSVAALSLLTAGRNCRTSTRHTGYSLADSPCPCDL